MADPFSIPVSDVPKLLAGARVYIAPHHGGTKALPDGLKPWLKAMGATLVTSIATPRRKPATHVLHQNENRGYNPHYTARRCLDLLREAHGATLSIVDGPHLNHGPASADRVEVVLCDTATFLDACSDAVRDQLRKDAGDRLRDALFDTLRIAPGAFVGF